jgi:hypothetical protein
VLELFLFSLKGIASMGITCTEGVDLFGNALFLFETRTISSMSRLGKAHKGARANVSVSFNRDENKNPKS